MGLEEEKNGLKLTDKLKQAFEYASSLGLRFTSGYRPGSTGPSGKADSHSVGMAFDFAGSADSMKTFSDWAKKSGLFTEVLYGADGHFDHVHAGWQTGKHPNGQMYVGNHQLQPIPNGGADIPTGGSGGATSSPSSDKSWWGAAFTGVVRATIIILFLILAVYFLFQAFPELKVKL